MTFAVMLRLQSRRRTRRNVRKLFRVLENQLEFSSSVQMLVCPFFGLVGAIKCRKSIQRVEYPRRRALLGIHEVLLVTYRELYTRIALSALTEFEQIKNEEVA